MVASRSSGSAPRRGLDSAILPAQEFMSRKSGLSRPRSVATTPGWKATAVMPVPAVRRASSRVNRIVASLDAG
jgi:hypothetical protein